MIGRMAGDVNIFLVPNYDSNVEDDHDDTVDAKQHMMRTTTTNMAELEIMLAEEWARGRAQAAPILLMMMRYARDTLDLRQFTAKVGGSNLQSRALFERKLGFALRRHVEIFDEVELVRCLRRTDGNASSGQFVSDVDVDGVEYEVVTGVDVDELRQAVERSLGATST